MNLINKRLEAFVTDVIISFAAGIPFFLISLLLNNNLIWMSFTLAFMYALLFCKDVENGRSFGKQNTGLCILSEKNEKAPSITRLFLRNLFYVLWPIEIILIFCNSGKRLGDLVMRTKVVQCAKEPNTTFRLTSKYLCSIFVVTIVLFVLFFFITRLIYEHSPMMRLLYSWDN
ncbi:RDD family protein [Bacteroides sp.]